MIFVISHLKSFKRLSEKVKGGEDYQLVARKHKVSLVDRNILIKLKNSSSNIYSLIKTIPDEGKA